MAESVEPVRNIFTPEWERAERRVRARQSRGADEPFGAALEQIRQGWTDVRPLAHWCESSERDVTPWLHALLWHVEVEVVDLFRWISHETTQIIPTQRAARRSGGCIDDLETEVEALRRNLRMLLLAVHHPEIPADVRSMAEPRALALVEWTLRFGGTVARIRPVLDATEEGDEEE